MRRTKVIDEEFGFLGSNGIPAHCRIRVFTGDGLPPVMIASECEDNEGQSVTNAAEVLFASAIARYLPGWLDQADGLMLIEHYPAHNTFDHVSFVSWRPVIQERRGYRYVSFGSPSWQHLGEAATRDLVGEIE